MVLDEDIEVGRMNSVCEFTATELKENLRRIQLGITIYHLLLISGSSQYKLRWDRH